GGLSSRGRGAAVCGAAGREPPPTPFVGGAGRWGACLLSPLGGEWNFVVVAGRPAVARSSRRRFSCQPRPCEFPLCWLADANAVNDLALPFRRGLGNFVPRSRPAISIITCQ